MLKKDLIDELNKQNFSLAKRIRRENRIGGSSDKAYSFIITCLKVLYPGITDKELKRCITDDHNDGSIDAIKPLIESRIVSVLDIKNREKLKYNDVLVLENNIRRYILTPQQGLSGLSEMVKKRIREARKHISRGYKMEIYVLRNRDSDFPPRPKRIMERLKNDFDSVESYNFFNKHKLIEKHLETKPDELDYMWKVKVALGNNDPTSPVDKIIIRKTRRSPTVESMIARVRLIDIIKLQKDFINKKFDLFGANVRGFQKNKILSTKINDSIKKNPELFYMFHNGLTFSCRDITRVNENEYKIKNPQVINGCQTVSTIYENYRNKLQNPQLRAATVLCRFHALESDMVEKVCEATNTQLKINLWDLRSNDKIQKLFEKALNLKGVDYTRKKTTRKKGRILITDLAQWLYSCKHVKPAEAKDKKSRLFDIILADPPYRKIFNERVSLDELIIICNIALFVKDEIKKIPKSRRSFEKDADFHFIAALFLLKEKSWSQNYKFRRIRKIIREVVEEMRRKYGRDFSYNKIFTKTEETWKIIEIKLRRI